MRYVEGIKYYSVCVYLTSIRWYRYRCAGADTSANVSNNAVNKFWPDFADRSGSDGGLYEITETATLFSAERRSTAELIGY
ncbi:hypothetical protein U1Q18_047575 [Sarracenia purpurea var. burkii]